MNLISVQADKNYGDLLLLLSAALQDEWRRLCGYYTFLSMASLNRT